MSVSSFRHRVREALADARLRRAVRFTTGRFASARRAALDELEAMAREGWAAAGFEELRRRARAIKRDVVEHLDAYLEKAVAAIRSAGGHVHYAADGFQAGEIVRRIAADAGVRLAVKSKSMATEEVHLNAALALGGVQVVETDLGEFIVQLAGETPSHIVAPAIHQTREQIGRLFGHLVGEVVATDTPTLTRVARRVLRERFLEAGMGISGANFVVAETGTLVLVTNEGNGRMVTTVPRVHVALVGVEKLVPRLDDLPVFLHLLARSATGQKLSVYTHLVTGPRRSGETDGPEELHVVFLDGGRRKLRKSRYQEVLHCIRCGACLNHCPVYQQVGGHAYGSVYSGPIGVVLTPQLFGLGDWRALPVEACSLCAACTEVCPVGIPLHELILEERADIVRKGMDDSGLGPPLRALARAWERPWAFRASVRSGRMVARQIAARRIPAPGILGNWTAARDLPPPAPRSFHEWWEQRRRQDAPGGQAARGPTPPVNPVRDRTRVDGLPAGQAMAVQAGATGLGHEQRRPSRAIVHAPEALRARLVRELEKLHVRVHDGAGELGALVAAIAREHLDAGRHAMIPARGPGDPVVVVWDDPLLREAGIEGYLAAQGIPAVVWKGQPDRGGPGSPGAGGLREAAARALVGVTTVDWAVAASGTLVLTSGPGRGRSVSLLPWVHVAVVPERALVARLEDVPLGRLDASSVVLVTGPSRSADIENDLSIGVHGPGEVHVVLVAGARPANGAAGPGGALAK
ncbi:LutB/LldF family L-lactate oxidation iron-sulfur protein [Carboxydochorda subterranea]|uniref:LutB/LldF family L-lactate oxidation iron-sulfur protein n=1 Tax=Carboxydichorda subterranea TaxID=3109565 RepID=A0ABZ1BVD1_9FIRM|nr:LutB/LldF family L-lactate oxidation iron-sulfur protein [Limnochorda sp. L945t]WRP16123.1 LutB/LldF family L-lactate oxidation iron-sulfur protein [Limnochorda sp. L945t]